MVEMMGDFARVTGNLGAFQEMIARFKAIDDGLKERSLRSAGGAAANVLKEEAVRLAPVYPGEIHGKHPPPGTLKESIIVKRVQELCGPYRQYYIVTIRRGKRQASDDGIDAYYALWVEKGHYKRVGMTDMKHRKARKAGLLPAAQWVPPSPFMRPAFEAKRDEAAEVMRKRILEVMNNPSLMDRNPAEPGNE